MVRRRVQLNAVQTLALGFAALILLGGVLLCGADLLARSAAAVELPVSIFTSLLGAPFLIWLVGRERRGI